MIPKTIHWCWLSETYPELVSKCLQTWHKFCPDYEIVRWDLEKSDLANTPKWCQIAYENRLYAFCADFIRARAIYEEGGVYLDSDVCIRKHNPFEEYRNEKLWIPMEDVRSDYFKKVNYLQRDTKGGYIYDIGINPVFMGAEPHHPFFKEVIDVYWELEDDYAIKASKWKAPIAPHIYSKVMEKYGLKYCNIEQKLAEGIHILSSEKFNHLPDVKDKNKMTAIHLCTHTWVR